MPSQSMNNPMASRIEQTLGSHFLSITASSKEAKRVPFSAHPHFWGTDELMQRLRDGVIASEAISS